MRSIVCFACYVRELSVEGLLHNTLGLRIQSRCGCVCVCAREGASSSEQSCVLYKATSLHEVSERICVVLYVRLLNMRSVGRGPLAPPAPTSHPVPMWLCVCARESE